ncbi:hypothetical protein GCM10027442_30070 [Emticicia fontis]
MTSLLGSTSSFKTIVLVKAREEEKCWEEKGLKKEADFFVCLLGCKNFLVFNTCVLSHGIPIFAKVMCVTKTHSKLKSKHFFMGVRKNDLVRKAKTYQFKL